MTDVYVPDLSEVDLDFVFADQASAPASVNGVQRFSVGPADDLEFNGNKQSQRVEVTETQTSDDLNTQQQPLWYHWSVYIDPITENPSNLGARAKLHLGQFHQRGLDGTSDAPALMFNLLENGDLVAQFEQSVGKRAHVLVEGGIFGDGAKGQWVDIIVGAEWQIDEGWTEFYCRQEGEENFRFIAHDSGPNTSTGQVYFKYGVYRSFLERDPALAESISAASFRDVMRAETFDEVRSSNPTVDTFSANPPRIEDSIEQATPFVDHLDFG